VRNGSRDYIRVFPLSPSPDFSHPTRPAKNEVRANKHALGHSILAKPLLVEFTHSIDSRLPDTRSSKGHPNERSILKPQTHKLTPRKPGNVPDLLSSVTLPLYQFGDLWTLQILLSSGMSFRAFFHWFSEMKYDARRLKIIAWHHWYDFCLSRIFFSIFSKEK
jgi:hypothetical protein